MNTGVTAITEKILSEAKTWADEQTSAAKVEAQNTADEFSAKAKAEVDKTLAEASEKAKATGERAISQGEMDRRKMLLACLLVLLATFLVWHRAALRLLR